MPVSDFFSLRLPFQTPGGPFSSLSVSKASISAPNSLTGSPICEPSVPIGYTTLDRSARAGFVFLRSPVPVPDPRRAVFMPNCRKSVDFHSKLPNRESYLRAVSSYRLLYPRPKCPCWFQIFPIADSHSGPPAGRFRA
ncbi:hypothetical protein AAC387_Pa12g0580 [Persea americana]